MNTPLPRAALLAQPSPWPLLNDAQARAAEAAAAAVLPPHTLMQRAGDAVARLARARYPHARDVAVYCGPGNNGGDGMVAATTLAAHGLRVQVWLLAAPHEGSDAHWAWQRAQQKRVAIHVGSTPPAWLHQAMDLRIDAWFGAGLRRAVEPSLIAALHGDGVPNAPVLAVDLPSGIAGDSGHAVDGHAVHADVTLALLALRPGHFTGDAPDAVGELWFDDLGAAAHWPVTQAHLSTAHAVQLPQRAATQHKGRSGDVWVVGSADAMTGAGLLSARAALACGAGRVYWCPLVDAALTHDPVMPELMLRRALPADATGCIVFGPGAGDSAKSRAALHAALHTAAPLVLDADGLNLAAADHLLREMLVRRRMPTVLTPHPLEAARLLACEAAAVQADRPGAALALAQGLHAVVVLKGAGTVLAHPDGGLRVNPTGSAALATAGSGDVLAGVIGALIAQGLDTWNAACSAVLAHGLAAEAAMADVLPASLQAQAVAHMLRRLRTAPA